MSDGPKLKEQHMADAFAYLTGGRRQGKSELLARGWAVFRPKSNEG